MKHKRGSKNISWRTVSPEDWAKGCIHVGRLKGVSGNVARTAYRKLSGGLSLNVSGGGRFRKD